MSQLAEDTTTLLNLKPFESPIVDHDWGSPEAMFQQKVEHLMDLLGCSESKATHLILHYL